MLINKTYKYCFYSNKRKEIFIVKMIGYSYFVSNRFLTKWNRTYKETGEELTCYSYFSELISERIYSDEQN
ncbi:helix-turn-helix domain-containing protein [Bacillus thuringiensis]|uniref:helix-turn-helix domain-containing protein n=1 Tax=Bacillus thuringiensis TaxID=1428 RepID=UPI002224C89C|nr:helix-turn-helix domain-containing protein [Bacillus thuringiensis]UYX52308.1 helix-turn-helix domain-containing protein [Bacillus thuringiensis]